MAAVRAQDVLQVVTSLHRLQPDWRTFFHEVFGLDGILQKAFPDSAARAEFEQTDEYRGIQRMLEELRPQGAGGSSAAPSEPPVVMTVRIPKSLHGALRDEAHERRVSLNTLCVAKLLQILDPANELPEGAGPTRPRARTARPR